jgi:hypothetical protein
LDATENDDQSTATEEPKLEYKKPEFFNLEQDCLRLGLFNKTLLEKYKIGAIIAETKNDTRVYNISLQDDFLTSRYVMKMS